MSGIIIWGENLPVLVQFVAVFAGMLNSEDSSEAVVKNYQRSPSQSLVIPCEFFIHLQLRICSVAGHCFCMMECFMLRWQTVVLAPLMLWAGGMLAAAGQSGS